MYECVAKVHTLIQKSGVKWTMDTIALWGDVREALRVGDGSPLRESLERDPSLLQSEIPSANLLIYISTKSSTSSISVRFINM